MVRWMALEIAEGTSDGMPNDADVGNNDGVWGKSMPRFRSFTLGGLSNWQRSRAMDG